jgi:ankyrin repeat protein
LGNVEIAKILVAAGADVNAKEKYGISPIALAITEKD